jgi:putative transposase
LWCSRVRVLTLMRHPLKRYYGQGDLHFVTFSCYRRRALLGTAHARDCFLTVLDQVRCKKNFLLLGFVVMPEHAHLLFSEAQASDPSEVLQVLKQQVCRALRKKPRKPAAGQPALGLAAETEQHQHFWQRRFYDFNVWSERKLREKLNYMHANPVKRKLVLHPGDWPWSSWSHYAKGEEGLLRIDPLEGKSARPSQKEESQNPHP